MPKRIFTTVAEAMAALRDADSSGGRAMASVWFRADSVFVATAHGTGTFPIDDWRKSDGPRSSVETARGDAS